MFLLQLSASHCLFSYFSGPLPSELGGIEQQYVELYSHVQTLLSRCKLHTRFQVPSIANQKVGDT